jgi:hypothetical protein
MNTYPGNRKYARVHQKRDRGISSTIPPWLPRWYAIESTDMVYARRSHRDKEKVTIFNRTKMEKSEMDRSSAKGLLILKEKLSDVNNHRVEDLFECLFIIIGRNNHL